MTERPVTRREVLALGARWTAGGAGLLALPAALAACGGGATELGPQAAAVAGSSIAIDYASYHAPYEDLRRLVESRARERRLSVRFSEDPSGAAAQRASLLRLTGPRSGFRMVVVAAFDQAAIDPIAADARSRGFDVVGYITQLPHQTAGIVVDAAEAARLLAADARTWARRRPGGHAQALLVGAPETQVVPDPFLPYAHDAQLALAGALASGPLHVVATTTAIGAADARSAVRTALRRHPGIDVVLTVDDTTALGAARALPPARSASTYVGAVGAPAISGAASLRALDDAGPLRCLVAPRLRDLADALVDVPAAMLRGRAAVATTIVPLETFTAGSHSTAAAAIRDYRGA